MEAVVQQLTAWWPPFTHGTQAEKSDNAAATRELWIALSLCLLATDVTSSAHSKAGAESMKFPHVSPKIGGGFWSSPSPV